MQETSSNNNPTLEGLKEALIKQANDVSKIDESISVLQETYETTKTESILKMITKYENISLDKKQVIVNIKVCIVKLEQAFKQARKIEEEVNLQYKSLIALRAERTELKLKSLPIDSVINENKNNEAQDLDHARSIAVAGDVDFSDLQVQAASKSSSNKLKDKKLF